jgi:hypothetical protein
VTEFEAAASLWRKHAEKAGKTIGVSMEIRRQLKKHRADFVTQQRQTIFHQFEAVDGIGGEPLPMGDELGGLPGNDEALAGLLLPASDGLRRRCPVEHAIELGALKLTGVVLQLRFNRKTGGVPATNHNASRMCRSGREP